VFTAPSSAANPPRPERVLNVWDSVSMVEVSQQFEDGSTRVTGYRVCARDGGSSVLHATLGEAETDFLRRTWR
jgi:hypothetical protein